MAILFAPYLRATDQTNAPIPGAFATFYASNTSTLQAIYADVALSIPLANPQQSDGNGVFSQIWLDDSLPPYKVILQYPDTNNPSIPGAIVPGARGTIDPYNSPFNSAVLGPLIYPRTAAEISAAIVPLNYAYEALDPRRYGFIGDGSHPTEDAAAWQSWQTVIGNSSTAGQKQDERNWSRAEPSSMGLGPDALVHVNLGATENMGIGPSAASNITTGAANTAVGYSALPAATTPQFVTSVGANSMLSYTTGLGFSCAFGYGAYARGLTGYNNVAVGFESLHDNGAGTDNTALGTAALHAGTNGVPAAPADPTSCVAIGSQAAKFAYGSNNVAIGFDCMEGGVTSSGDKNVAVGSTAMQFFTTATRCVSVGYQASLNKTTGTDDVIIGNQAGLSQTTGGFNVYLGSLCGYYNAQSQQNLAAGYLALQGLVGNGGGGGNVALGANAMDTSGTVSNCVAVGFQSLRTVTGNGNVAVGHQAGTQETTGTNNTWVGEAAGAAQTVGLTNTTNIGYQATSLASNDITLGNSSVARLRCQVTSITGLSDARFKKDIDDLAIPAGFFDEIRAVTFKWAVEGMPTGTQVGVIAQELDALQEKYKVQWLGLVDKSNPDRWEATPGKLLFLLLQRVQRQEQRLRRIEELLSI